MKKSLFTTLICLISLFAMSQSPAPSKEITDFKNYTAELENNRRAATEKKDYITAGNLCAEWIAKYEHATPAIIQNFKSLNPGMYYNLACYVNLHGKSEEALTALEKSVSLGYSNYANTKVDTDLENLHDNKRFKAALNTLRERGDMGYILQKSGPYDNKTTNASPVFTYQSASSPELVDLKNKFNLDSVAGKKDEISKFKNLLYWVHNQVKHDGNSNNPSSRNAVDLIAVCKKENRGVNCRMMATILRDVYQAEGFKTRVVTCMPKDTLDNDCHVITVVWSKTLNKWVWMDPTFNAYVTDTKGNLLNIEEVRQHLVKNGTADLVLNDDANWNNKNKQTKDNYLGYYMSKNLYWLQCAAKSEWDIETGKPGKGPIQYVNLYPGNFTTLHISGGSVKESNRYATNNPTYFWQKPGDL
ncbi:transglutaminase-like domain-containing protein [Mucilaginibacter boryungensis]|uniref:Transglutaminase domain-containing protein n=1 Tax=Mucilaginibacter boryungensis TaxID=768480 RepID=A0ABR9XGW0_9SPHI|nr:transglutaminase-like domain-containing protein [Mucilaginibacter boryungensis]MBE9666295.1 transglutaminase domain-containing protein [Mucilaginibacter boryungensis]